MDKFISFALAASASALLVTAPAPVHAQDSAASYQSMTDKAASDYKMARVACDTNSGNAKKVCQQEARLARTRAEAEAVAQYRNTPRDVSRARKSVADAEYDVAKARCDDRSGSDKSACLNDAKATRTAALAADSSGAPGSSIADAARRSGGNAKTAVADTVITTKIKADLVRAPDLKALDVHVETVDGVVMLSGFVPSQAEAAKAVEMARGVEGVTDVKSALKVK